MTTEQMNKDVAEWLGIEWHTLSVIPFSTHHGWEEREWICSCCRKTWKQDDKPRHDKCPKDPDFSQGAGIIRLLKEMMAKLSRKEWAKFLNDTGLGYWEADDQSVGIMTETNLIEVDYITEDGKLLKAVHQWSKEPPR